MIQRTHKQIVAFMGILPEKYLLSLLWVKCTSTIPYPIVHPAQAAAINEMVPCRPGSIVLDVCSATTVRILYFVHYQRDVCVSDGVTYS